MTQLKVGKSFSETIYDLNHFTVTMVFTFILKQLTLLYVSNNNTFCDLFHLIYSQLSRSNKARESCTSPVTVGPTKL